MFTKILLILEQRKITADKLNVFINKKIKINKYVWHMLVGRRTDGYKLFLKMNSSSTNLVLMETIKLAKKLKSKCVKLTSKFDSIEALSWCGTGCS